MAVVEDANLRFPFYQERAELHISALSFFEEPQTLTVRGGGPARGGHSAG